MKRCLLGVALLSPGAATLLVLVTGAWPAFPRGGVTRDAAIRVARNLAEPGAARVLSAVIQHDVTGAMGGSDVHQWVWLVTFEGHWQLLCAGTPDACNPTTEWVAIDYSTGAWVRSQYAYPAGCRSSPETGGAYFASLFQVQYATIADGQSTDNPRRCKGFGALSVALRTSVRYNIACACCSRCTHQRPHPGGRRAGRGIARSAF